MPCAYVPAYTLLPVWAMDRMKPPYGPVVGSHWEQAPDTMPNARKHENALIRVVNFSMLRMVLDLPCKAKDMGSGHFAA